MTKYLKFRDELVSEILSGKKTITWRINDEKNISKGDELSLQRNDGAEFAKALVISVRETTFGQLTEADKAGHEPFKSDEEMYRIYSRDYKMKVLPATKVKIIKFRLITQSSPCSLSSRADRCRK